MKEHNVKSIAIFVKNIKQLPLDGDSVDISAQLVPPLYNNLTFVDYVVLYYMELIQVYMDLILQLINQSFRYPEVYLEQFYTYTVNLSVIQRILEHFLRGYQQQLR